MTCHRKLHNSSAIRAWRGPFGRGGLGMPQEKIPKHSHHHSRQDKHSCVQRVSWRAHPGVNAGITVDKPPSGATPLVQRKAKTLRSISFSKFEEDSSPWIFSCGESPSLHRSRRKILALLLTHNAGLFREPRVGLVSFELHGHGWPLAAAQGARKIALELWLLFGFRNANTTNALHNSWKQELGSNCERAIGRWAEIATWVCASEWKFE